MTRESRGKDPTRLKRTGSLVLENAKRVQHRNLQSNRIAVVEPAISRDKRTSSVHKIDKNIRVPTGTGLEYEALKDVGAQQDKINGV